MKARSLAFVFFAFDACAPAQNDHWYSHVVSAYHAPPVAPIDFRNSPRIDNLIRAGILYLSLPDAIALAVENNLDVEFERLALPVANTDILRAKGGGTLRGISLTVAEAPAGIGGPPAPVLNAVYPTGTSPVPAYTPNLTTFAPAITAASPFNSSVVTSFGVLPDIAPTQTGIDINGAAALSLGPPIPQFDPVLTTAETWQHETVPELTAFTSGLSTFVADNSTTTFGFSQGFSSGALVTAGFTGVHEHSNATNFIFNPFISSGLNVNVVQPLLRGFGPAVNRRFIRIARNNLETTDLLFRQQLISTIYGTVRLYEDLVSLGEDVKVQEETLALAERLYQDNRSQVEHGTLAPVELTRAQASVATARQNLAYSRGNFAQQQLILKTFLTRRGTADPAVRLARIQTTTPLDIPAREPVRPAEDYVVEGLQKRPELGEARLQIENSHIALRGSRNELLPELDLVASSQNVGLAGQRNPFAGPTALPPPPGTIGGLGTNLKQVFTGRYPTYSIGVQLSVPLRNRIARADVARDEIQIRQWDIRRQQLENQIRLEVEADVVALTQARAALDAAIEARILQEQSLKIEQEKYSVGLSTTFLVIQYENFLAQARSTEVAARNVYVKARAALERATGTIVEDHGISVQEALSGRLSH
jgi:outer membrane protein TolC